MSDAVAPRPGSRDTANQLRPEDRAGHDWYRFVLSFPPHLVRTYLDRFRVTPAQRVLDPFCGAGTVLVECKKLGIPGAGVEANPIAVFAARVKTDWRPDPDGLAAHAHLVAAAARAALADEGIPDEPCIGAGDGRPPLPTSADGGTRRRLRLLPVERQRLLPAGAISPLPLHKTLTLLACMEQHRDGRYRDHERLVLARALVASIGNLRFGPEVGVGPAKLDAAVIAPWLAGVEAMAEDLRVLGGRAPAPAAVIEADARRLGPVLAPASIDAVITSPPYPNEKDYTRATRLESVLLGFVRDRDDLRALKRGLVRSNTRGVYATDDDDRWTARYPEVEQIAREIEGRRVALGKTSGFERLYARVTRLYFGGMARHLAGLRGVLRPGARLAYVVGDQASFLRVLIPTGQLLAGIAASLGYEVEDIELFRTRRATATGQDLREEVVLLRWPAGP